jgi:hypothetical protein
VTRVPSRVLSAASSTSRRFLNCLLVTASDSVLPPSMALVSLAKSNASPCLGLTQDAQLVRVDIMSLILESVSPRPLMVDALGALKESDILTAALTNNFRSREGDRFASTLAEV